MIAKSLMCGAAVLAMSAAATAGEEAKTYPNLHIVLPIELQWDNTFDADVPGAETSDLYFTIEPEVTIGLNEWLRVEMGLVFEPIDDLDPFEDRALEDHGLFVEVVQAVAEFGNVTVNVGKFSAPFSIAFDYAPGVFGDVLNADLEVTERLGGGIAYNFSGPGTDSGVIVRAAVFQRDTSFLSGSAFTNRGRLDEAAGGPGNTDTLNNFSLAIDIINLEQLPGVHLHAAYLSQSKGLGDAESQDAFVAGAFWEKEAAEGVVYQLLAEVAVSDGAHGYGDAVSIPGGGQTDLTLGAAGIWHDTWTAAVGYNFRDAEDPIGGDVETQAFHLSVGRYFCEKWLAEVAYLNISEDGNDSQTVGLKLSTEFEWRAH